MNFKIGDVVQYVRHTDGTTVRGKISRIHHPSDLTPNEMFLQPQLRGEHMAYRLELDGETQRRVGHPVTVGASRVVAAP